MRVCVLCRFTVEADDVVITFTSGRCVCLVCFERETETAQPTPRVLRKEIEALLAAK